MILKVIILLTLLVFIINTKARISDNKNDNNNDNDNDNNNDDTRTILSNQLKETIKLKVIV